LSTHELQASSGQHAHDENIDHQGNANLAVWLGLVSLTFMTATFVGTNLYLRGWSPSKFSLPMLPILRDVPYWDTLALLVAAILLFIAGALYTANRWKAFNGVLALATLVFVGVLIAQFDLMLRFSQSSQQITTIYAPTATIQFLLTLVCVIMFAFAGYYASYGNKAKINSYFPVAMNVWLYTIASGIMILFTEDVMSVGRFAAWCGQHLT
jgi:uncharacterized membrane protein YozB (DUF420 family)